MFQKIYKAFNELPNVCGIADDILIVGYNGDGTDHDRTPLKESRYVDRKS